MKTIGRLLLLVCGVVLMVLNIEGFVYSIGEMNKSGWPIATFFDDPAVRSQFVTFIAACFSVVAGLTAVISSLLGKRTFFCTIFASVMIVLVVWVIVSKAINGEFTDFWSVASQILSLLTPLGYFVGNKLMKFDD